MNCACTANKYGTRGTWGVPSFAGVYGAYYDVMSMPGGYDYRVRDNGRVEIIGGPKNTGKVYSQTSGTGLGIMQQIRDMGRSQSFTGGSALGSGSGGAGYASGSSPRWAQDVSAGVQTFGPLVTSLVGAFVPGTQDSMSYLQNQLTGQTQAYQQSANPGEKAALAAQITSLQGQIATLARQQDQTGQAAPAMQQYATGAAAPFVSSAPEWVPYAVLGGIAVLGFGVIFLTGRK